MHNTVSLPSFCASAIVTAIVSSEVAVPLTTSINLITPTGLKKCIPITLSGLFVTLAIEVLFNIDELDASIVSGGALVLANLYASARKLKNTSFDNRAGVLASVVGGFYLRLAVLAACLYFLITYIQVDPVGLVAGLSIIPAGMLVMLALIYLANRRPEEA